MNLYILVDDVSVNNTILEAFLKRLDPNCMIFCAETADEAINLYIDLCQSKYGIRAIFTDYRMPGKNGAEFIKEIRNGPCNTPPGVCAGQCKSVPIFVVTADGKIEEVEGCTDVVHKPLDKEMLHILLHKYSICPFSSAE